ncbi:MFS transporter [Bradyrhizobium sp. 200]|uniref:MFS transporter n=1 Tax=Bradyrhizobium sp. 200 TaxID=2782665 RepID=UPI001FFF8892|nr:MFS transporter [Bradyrhizobium sp. 200]
MQEVQLLRQRNGAYGSSIARDIADPELWTERYHYPTSAQPLDPVGARAGPAGGGHIGPQPVRIRRMLPFGTMRWKEDAHHHAANDVLPGDCKHGGRR